MLVLITTHDHGFRAHLPASLLSIRCPTYAQEELHAAGAELAATKAERDSAAAAAREQQQAAAAQVAALNEQCAAAERQARQNQATL
jgi:hypothetical protein